MKIESNISSIEIRMHRKMQKYALRTLKMTEKHSIRMRIPIFYFSEWVDKHDSPVRDVDYESVSSRRFI